MDQMPSILKFISLGCDFPKEYGIFFTVCQFPFTSIENNSFRVLCPFKVGSNWKFLSPTVGNLKSLAIHTSVEQLSGFTHILETTPLAFVVLQVVHNFNVELIISCTSGESTHLPQHGVGLAPPCTCTLYYVALHRKLHVPKTLWVADVNVVCTSTFLKFSKCWKEMINGKGKIRLRCSELCKKIQWHPVAHVKVTKRSDRWQLEKYVLNLSLYVYWLIHTTLTRIRGHEFLRNLYVYI